MDPPIFKNDAKLYCYFIDNAGPFDLFKTLNDNYIWNSYKKILDFAKKIIEALAWLHSHKICHLDIKPENIMVNPHKKSFKLIDLGLLQKNHLMIMCQMSAELPDIFLGIFHQKFHRQVCLVFKLMIEIL